MLQVNMLVIKKISMVNGINHANTHVKPIINKSLEVWIQQISCFLYAFWAICPMPKYTCKDVQTL